MTELVLLRVKTRQASTIRSNPNISVFIFIQTLYRTVAQTVIISGRHIPIAEHMHFLDSNHTAAHRTSPHIVTVVLIQTIDRAERKRIGIADNIADILESPSRHIINTDTSAIGCEPQLTVALFDVKDNVIA